MYSVYLCSLGRDGGSGSILHAFYFICCLLSLSCSFVSLFISLRLSFFVYCVVLFFSLPFYLCLCYVISLSLFLCVCMYVYLAWCVSFTSAIGLTEKNIHFYVFFIFLFSNLIYCIVLLLFYYLRCFLFFCYL